MMSIQRSLSYSSKSNKVIIPHSTHFSITLQVLKIIDCFLQLSSILRLSFSSNVPPAKSQSSSTENVKPDVGGSSVPGLSSKVVNVPSAGKIWVFHSFFRDLCAQRYLEILHYLWINSSTIVVHSQSTIISRCTG